VDSNRVREFKQVFGGCFAHGHGTSFESVWGIPDCIRGVHICEYIELNVEYIVPASWAGHVSGLPFLWAFVFYGVHGEGDSTK